MNVGLQIKYGRVVNCMSVASLSKNNYPDWWLKRKETLRSTNLLSNDQYTYMLQHWQRDKYFYMKFLQSLNAASTTYNEFFKNWIKQHTYNLNRNISFPLLLNAIICKFALIAYS